MLALMEIRNDVTESQIAAAFGTFTLCLVISLLDYLASLVNLKFVTVCLTTVSKNSMKLRTW